MAATRTQVYFTAEQRARLDERAALEKRTLAEIVREAVDRYLEDHMTDEERERILDETFGALKGKGLRFRIPSRDEWDRDFG